MTAHAQTVSLDPEIAARAGQLAKARGQTLEAFVDKAVSDALEEQVAFEAAMAEAEQDFAEGRVHSHEEVLAVLASMRAEAEAEIARRNRAS